MNFKDLSDPNKSLRVLDKLDTRSELKITVQNRFKDATIYLSKKEVKRLIEHLTNVL